MGHRIGVIGCGNISGTYFEKGPLFKGLDIVACADANHAAAEAAAGKHGIKAVPVEELLGDDSVDAVVNLTVPDAHCEVSASILEAGKHCYSEKPLSVKLEDGKRIQELAESKGLVAGCAPDTFLGGAHQRARKAVDDGDVGRVTTGSCHVQSPGMEMWHPNPDFFFRPGGGPVLDLGPYYVANLVNLIGPVRRLAAMSNVAWEERTITSEPRSGERIKVETPTTLMALLEFDSGAKVTFTASWDVWAHGHRNMEIYGTEGTLYVPDPNFFNGDVVLVGRDGKEETLPDGGHPFGVPNLEHQGMQLANYRTAGLADMLDAVAEGREPRCSVGRALHSLEVMLGILESAREGRYVDIESSCDRPEPLGPEQARALLN